MPAVATQTSWCWLQDLAELDELSRVYRSTNHHFSTTAQLEGESCNDPHSGVEDSVGSSPMKELENTGKKESRSRESRRLGRNTKRSEIPESSAPAGSSSKLELPKVEEENCAEMHAQESTSYVHLPPLVEDEHQRQSLDGSVGQKQSLDDNVDQRESLDGSIDPKQSLDDNVDQRQSLDGKIGHNELPSAQLSISAKEVLLPSILKYTRESESSESHELFSEQYLEKTKDSLAKIWEDKCKLSSMSKGGVKASLCEFCGKTVYRRNFKEMLKAASSGEEESFCCEVYKEYLILYDTNLKEMVERKRNAPIEMISIKIKNNSPPRKPEEEKLLEELRKKQKWEEIQRRKEMEDEVKKLRLKGAEIIRFSLELDDETKRGWTTRPKSIVKCTEPSSRRKRKATVSEKEKESDVFSPKTLQNLKSGKKERKQGKLVRRLFDTGLTHFTLLPNRTGVCNYPSGNAAVVICSLYGGILSYFAYEDCRGSPTLLCYMDELGRSYCYFPNNRIRFLRCSYFMMNCDQDGHILKKSSNTADPRHHSPHFPAISLNLNQHLTFKCSPDKAMLSFSLPNERDIKFTAATKLKKNLKLPKKCLLQQGPLPCYAHKLQSEARTTEAYLDKSKKKIRELVSHLQRHS